MRQTTALSNSIPGFLRRPKERSPSKLLISGRPKAGGAALPPLPRPEATIHGGVAPVQPDFLAAAVSGYAPVPSPVSAPRPAPSPAPTPAPSLLNPTARPAPRRAALPWLAHKAPAAAVPASREAESAVRTDVVDLTAHRGAATLNGADPRKIQEDPRAAFDLEPEDTAEDDDAAFQVTLPRSVIRQIRVRAAEEGTTHRALVLRALRVAGLEVAAGADVDRRAAAAKRRQQA